MPNTAGARKSDYWYSRNKVLGLNQGIGRKPHARNPNFDTEETKLLISLWGDPKVQKTLITTHKKSPVIEKLAQTMRVHGYYRSPEEINTRLKNLKCIYNRIKKDLEMGILTETTWKHYGNMEEILNRPIFGRDAAQERVRQQELQFKMKLERANSADKTLLSTDSLAFLKDFMDEGDEDDDDEFGDDEADMDEDELEYDPEMTTDESSSDSKHVTKVEVVNCSETEITPEIKVEGETLIVPKEEPIDVDDPDIEINPEITESRKPPEGQFKIKIATVSAPPTATTNKITITSQPQTTLKFTQAQYVMSSTTTSNTSAGKISLVPTNILLKPQTQQTSANLTFKPKQFLYTKASNQAGTIQTQMSNMTMPITSGTVTTNAGMPMKLLLVNRVPQNMNQSKDNIQTQSILQAQPAAHTIAHTTSPAPAQVITTPATIKSITPAQSAQTSIRPKLPDGGVRKPVPIIKPKCNLPGFRSLLHQIAQVEQQNLEINRQRLEMEKQRFEFEKSMAEKFLAILPNMQFHHNSNSSAPAPTSQTNNSPNDVSAATNGDGGGGTVAPTNNAILFCLSPKKEILDD